MNLHAWNAEQLRTKMLPGQAAVIRMADAEEQLVDMRDQIACVARLDLVFHDATESWGPVRAPTAEHAAAILAFVEQQKAVDHLVVQCRVGIGRSHAVLAALTRIRGDDPLPVLRHGTYNRLLYRLLLEAAGVTPEPQPLVSLAVRVKYRPDRLQAFVLCMQRQRYENWEVVAVTDGPDHNWAVRGMLLPMNEPRVRVLEAPEAKGHWGHPWRQAGIDACRGEYIGLSNDDNYYVPGYLEQMLLAMEGHGADLAFCKALHSYSAWDVVPEATDLGCWIGRAELVRRAKWPGNAADADITHIQQLLTLTGGKAAVVSKPLFVHN